MDATILAVAVPKLAVVFHASETDLVWFSSAYLLTLAAAMLPAGLLGDRYGRKKVLLVSLGLFGAGSLGCGLATSDVAFVLARIAVAAGGSGVVVMALSTFTVLFDEAERAKAVGIWAAVNFIGVAAGPILGGWILTDYWWGWVFLINIPVAVVGLAGTVLLVPESCAQQQPGIDWAGIGLSAAGLVSLTYGFVEAGQYGWGSAVALGPIAAGLVVLFGFLRFEHGVPEPLVDMKMFASRPYTWGVLLASVGVLSMIAALFLLPQYFQGVLGLDAMGSGLRLLPLVGGLAAGAIPAEKVAKVVGAKAAVATGFVLMALGLLLGATTGLRSGTGFLTTWTVVVGLGMGVAMATAASAALSQLSEDRAGIGSAVMQAVNKTGGPFGAALVGSVLAGAYRAHLGTSVPASFSATVRASVFNGVAVAQRLGSEALLQLVRSSFVHGMDVALVVSAGLALAGAALACAFLPGVRASVEEEVQVGRFARTQEG
jgi:EmrB/QacA subfamily drug resistance transporter